MKEFKHEQEPTLKYKGSKTSMATTAALEDWKPTTVLGPKCGGKHTSFNTMCVIATFPEQYQYKCADCGHIWTDFKANSLGSMQSWPNLEYEDVTPIGQMGWICPKCGRVYAPHMDWCTNCNGTYSPNFVYCGPTTISDVLDTERFTTSLGDPNNTIKGVCTNGNKSNT
jgi:hypothetical protein